MYDRFDLSTGAEVRTGLPARLALLEFVKALVRRGVSPAAVADALAFRGDRVFASLEGELTREEFVKGLSALPVSRGINPGEYYCEDHHILRHSGRTWALSRRWSGDAEAGILALVRSFGDRGITCRPTPPAAPAASSEDG